MSKADEAREVARDCQKCAQHYQDAPGTVSHLTTCDLYATIARLARIVERQQNQLDHLMPDKSDDV